MKISKDLFDQLQALDVSLLNDKGQEMPNPMPVEIPSGLNKPTTIEDRIAELVKHSLSKQAQQQEYETLDEANNFDLKDELVVELSGFELLEEEIPPAIEEVDPKKGVLPDQTAVETTQPDPPQGDPVLNE